MITGEFRYSLDEKNRLLIPARIRVEIAGNFIILTRGVEQCLWLFTHEEWKNFSQSLIGSTSLFQEKASLMQRRIIAPAQETEIDRTGRIIIPPTLREFAGLKKECIILGIQTYLEVWDEGSYAAYLAENEMRFKEAAEEIGNKIALMRISHSRCCWGPVLELLAPAGGAACWWTPPWEKAATPRRSWSAIPGSGWWAWTRIARSCNAPSPAGPVRRPGAPGAPRLRRAFRTF